MIDAKIFLNFLKRQSVNFFCGVPDSTLKDFSNIIENEKNHFICTNEGSAVSLAIGNYLTTKSPGLVYMQNSGLGNAINPLISIAEETVYSIPLILLIGWRGSPELNDEPQHLAKGKITIQLLKNLKIPYIILKNKQDFEKIKGLINFSKKRKIPIALLCKPGILVHDNEIIRKNNAKLLTRKNVILKILENISKNDKIISTTGYTSRELFQIRKNYKIKKGKDFYMVGGMGHCAMLALGVSLKSKNKVICIDGDGSLLMHMGALGSVAAFAKKNYKYILLNNFSHRSVGGQKTISKQINFCLLAKSLNFKSYFLIRNQKNYHLNIKKFLKFKGTGFLEVRIQIKSMKNLSRPLNLKKIKNFFMQ